MLWTSWYSHVYLVPIWSAYADALENHHAHAPDPETRSAFELYVDSTNLVWATLIRVFSKSKKKLKIFKKHRYLTSFSVGSIPLTKWGQITVFFEIFEFWKPIFSSRSIVMDRMEFFENNWVHCRHFGQLSPGVRPFPQKSPISQNNE